MTGVVAVMAGGSVGGLVTVSPPSAFVTGETTPLATNFVTASVAGGGVYDFSWTYVSGDAQIVPTGTFGATIRWTADIPSNTSYFATWRVTATAFGTPVGSVDVSVGIERV